MGHVDWWYLPEGPGQIADIVSHQPGVQAELRSKAHKIGRRAQTLLDSLPENRTGASQVKVSKGDLDWYVDLTDPEGKGGAAGIEMRFGILRKAVG